jgi:DnaK suppressor protein
MTKAKRELTDKDVLAMPPKDYMNSVQLEYFRKKLLAMREEILAHAEETVEHMRETEAQADPADRATQEEEHALELRTRDRERKLLRKIDQALQRIADGSFGYCVETGEEIGVARLLARPTASLTVDAQERHERKELQYGD